jgi:CRISPR/Cas system CSM-associated protein Csm3 (group 7 of RAMP superfamily)
MTQIAATTVLRLSVPVVFPAGVAPGESKDASHLEIARDGRGRLVLRGSSLAGVLRSAWSRGRDGRDAATWFGDAAGGDRGGSTSRIEVRDAVLETGGEEDRRGKFGPQISRRTHVQRDRHTGAPLDGALFTLDAAPPGTTATFTMVVQSDPHQVDDARGFLAELLGELKAGLTLGGSAARGIGRAALEGSATLRVFDLSKIDDHGAWLDELHGDGDERSGDEFVPRESSEPASRLSIDVTFAIPRGQDLLVGDGQGMLHTIEFQRVLDATGSEQLRLPGSSLRGAMRAWVSRLAAREGKPVADTLERRKGSEFAKGEGTGRGFPTDDEKVAWAADADSIPCPVMNLFGSLYAKGRIHVADACIPLPKTAMQTRTHVSIDRISGGASDGFLFDSEVLAAEKNVPPFEVSISVESPTEDEARWIAQTLQAIDMGLIRIGSSKSAGRLCLAKPPAASGPFADKFTSLKSMEVAHADA